MIEWLRISVLLCVFGFLKEIRPSEPFVYEYLKDPRWWNKSSEQIQQEVYPVATYAYLAQLVIVFLITDICRYKPLIIVLGLSGIIIWSMLIWSSTLLELQILEVVYGTFMAAEVAYYTYIYAKVPKEYYSQVTAHTRAAILAGRCLSGALAQTLVEFKLMNYKGLNYITLSAMIGATIWSFLLPSVQKSIYFHQDDPEKQSLASRRRYEGAFVLMKKHFVESFSKRYVTKWSIWWAFATCGFIQVQTYMQPLWSSIIYSKYSTNGNNDTAISEDQSVSLHNGVVEALLTLVGCVAAFSTSFIKTDWKQRGELVLSVCSIMAGMVLIISSQTSYILVSYACYIVFGGLYHFMITIATSEVAKCIAEDSFGLVFGLNTLVALILQTIMVLVIVTGDLGWAFNARCQHLAYGVYHMGIAVIFIVIGLVDWLQSQADTNKTY